jgi:hypothetical protein
VDTLLRHAPPGCVAHESSGRLVRVISMPATVEGVQVRGGNWRTLLHRAASFTQVASTTVILERIPKAWPNHAWEADMAGVGVRIGEGQDSIELVATPSPPPMTGKAAQWRFVERAYGAWVRARRR